MAVTADVASVGSEARYSRVLAMRARSCATVVSSSAKRGASRPDQAAAAAFDVIDERAELRELRIPRGALAVAPPDLLHDDGQAEDAARSRNAGIAHHLVKPVDTDELLLLVAAAAAPASARG